MITFGRRSSPALPSDRSARERTAIAIVALGGIATAVLSVLSALGGDAAMVFDDAQQLIAMAAALGALLVVRKVGNAEQRRIHGTLTLALVLCSIGFLVWDASPGPAAAAIPGDAFFLAGTVVIIAGVGATIVRGLDRQVLTAVGLDTLIFFFGVITAVMVVWNRTGGPSGGSASATTLIGAVVLYSAAAAGFIGLIARRIVPSVHGPWPVVFGIYGVGSSWLFWLDGAAQGEGTMISPADFLFSLAILIVAYGGVTWATPRSASPRYEWIARRMADLFPILAVVVAAAVDLLPRQTAGIDEVNAFAGATILAAMARQGYLVHT